MSIISLVLFSFSCTFIKTFVSIKNIAVESSVIVICIGFIFFLFSGDLEYRSVLLVVLELVGRMRLYFYISYLDR